MTRGQTHRPSEPARQHAALARDAALSRIPRTRRLLIAAAAGLTALFAAIASAVVPGRATTAGAHQQVGAARTTASRTSVAATSRQMPPLASPARLGLQGPASAPQAAPAPSQAAPAPSQAAPAPTPAPAASGPAAVSGGS